MIKFGIIAAGKGSRIKEEGSPLSKPLLPINGLPMIARLINIMRDCGATSVSVVCNPDMPDVVSYLQKLALASPFSIDILIRETESSLHSFHELVKTMQPDDRFIVSTVDSVSRAISFARYVKTLANLPSRIHGLMGVTTYIDDEKPLYVNLDKDSFITSFSDQPISQSSFISAGIYGFSCNVMPLLEECISQNISRMRNFQKFLINKGQSLKAFDMGDVVDVDTLSDLEKARLLLD